MAAKPFVNLNDFDLSQTVLDLSEIREMLPHRHEFAMVDRFIHLDTKNQLAIAVKDVAEDDWWCRAHFPGNPILPGVLMIEAAAQVGSVLWKKVADFPNDKLIGFGGVEDVRFRGQVRPPAQLIFVASGGRFRSRMAWLPTQAFVNGELVFEGTTLGAAI